jgi:hypothetical protein
MSYQITEPGSYNPDAGMDVFQNYYARNTGLSASYKAPRPEPLTTPAAKGKGLEGLFLETENLPYYQGTAEAPSVPLGDNKTNQYDLGLKKERCGCAGVSLPLP